ncbi:benzoate carboxyl methyltransferase-like [Primulina huaijiensis]|uniref:benzoate carboxyl methyltransferase-like n=1 Tax=Primulina huaijiensis TaxID=1492673 RepID=UPI003CC7978A
MGVQEVAVHMNAGDDVRSYANNSAHQKIGISKARHVLDETLKEMLADSGFPKCFKMADLGCSSGPNTLSVVAQIMGTIEGLCELKNVDELPEFEVFLNDLPGNDFNNLFKLLPEFYKKLNDHPVKNKGLRCFISGLPGSFYGRLFPTNALNFVYSSFSLQWLSKIPDGLEENKQNIHMAMASPPEIFDAYARQYQRDFTTFLTSRGEEMSCGGRMVLTFVGRSAEDPSTKDDCTHFKLLASVLLEMVNEGHVKETDLHSFNMPIYTPCKQEVEALIHNEGSFNLDKFEHFLVPWDAHVEHENTEDRASALGPKGSVPDYRRGKLVSDFIRAYTEPVLASHFGSSIIDDLYVRYAKKLAEYLSTEKPLFFNVIICLSKK